MSYIQRVNGLQNLVYVGIGCVVVTLLLLIVNVFAESTAVAWLVAAMAFISFLITATAFLVDRELPATPPPESNESQ